MVIEDLILGAVIRDRKAYETVKQSKHQFSDVVKQVWKQVDSIYSRDSNLEQVPRDLLHEYLKSHASNDKTAQLYINLADKAYGKKVSVANVMGLLREDTQARLALELADATRKRDTKQVSKLIEQLAKLDKAEDVDEPLNVTGGSSLADLVERRLNVSNLIKVYPLPLNEMLGGGCMGGHHIVGLAPPEVGKTALGITVSSGWIRQGLFGLYILNEDRRDDLELRMITNLTNTPAAKMRDPEVRETCQQKLDALEYKDRVVFVEAHPGKVEDIRRLFDKYKPRWCVLDQLRNMDAGKSESNTLRLDSVARGVRDLLKEYDVIGLSLTQAGDAARGKAVVDAGDVDGSKIGIPGACDVLVGMGCTPDMEQAGIRMLNVCKNKVAQEGQRHGHFQVQFLRDVSKLKGFN